MNKTVTLLLIDQMIASSITLPIEMLCAANDVLSAQKRDPRQRIKLNIAGTSSKAIRTAGMLDIQADTAFDSIQSSAIIFVPSLWRNPQPLLGKLTSLTTWLKKRYEQGSTICAVGTGAFILAEAGLLDNKPATTHWFYLKQFEKRYPKVTVKRHHLITQCDNIYCAGSVNSVADLMIHLIEKLFDHQTASLVEQQFSPEIRRSVNKVIYSFENNAHHQDELIATIQNWLMENANHKINMETLSHQFFISRRTLNRRFKIATNKTPGQYLTEVRLEIAKNLLKNTNLTMSELALHSGFQNTSYFSYTFNAFFQRSPKKYRNSVRAKLFSIEGNAS